MKELWRSCYCLYLTEIFPICSWDSFGVQCCRIHHIFPSRTRWHLTLLENSHFLAKLLVWAETGLRKHPGEVVRVTTELQNSGAQPSTCWSFLAKVSWVALGSMHPSVSRVAWFTLHSFSPSLSWKDTNTPALEQACSQVCSFAQIIQFVPHLDCRLLKSHFQDYKNTQLWQCQPV